MKTLKILAPPLIALMGVAVVASACFLTTWFPFVRAATTLPQNAAATQAKSTAVPQSPESPLTSADRDPVASMGGTPTDAHATADKVPRPRSEENDRYGYYGYGSIWPRQPTAENEGATKTKATTPSSGRRELNGRPLREIYAEQRCGQPPTRLAVRAMPMRPQPFRAESAVTARGSSAKVTGGSGTNLLGAAAGILVGVLVVDVFSAPDSPEAILLGIVIACLIVGCLIVEYRDNAKVKVAPAPATTGIGQFRELALLTLAVVRQQLESDRHLTTAMRPGSAPDGAAQTLATKCLSRIEVAKTAVKSLNLTSHDDVAALVTALLGLLDKTSAYFRARVAVLNGKSTSGSLAFGSMQGEIETQCLAVERRLSTLRA